MIKIAITGPSGSGKGFVTSLLRRKGFPSLDTDETVHELYRNPDFIEKVEKALQASLSENCEVDRKALSELVFENQDKMAILCSVVYPSVGLEIEKFFTKCEKEQAKIAFVEAPQLYEAGLENKFDAIITVTCPENKRLQRVMERDSISDKQALLRFSNQKSEEEYVKSGDYIICNDGSTPLNCQLEKILNAVLENPS